MAMHALLLQCPNYAFHHAVLLRAVRRDEFLVQAATLFFACDSGATFVRVRTVATGSEEVFKVNAKMAATQITPTIEARIFQVDVILMIWGHEPVSLALEYPPPR